MPLLYLVDSAGARITDQIEMFPGRRGAGRIFYFRPGHETLPIYHNPDVHKVLRNGVHWAANK